MWVIKIDGFQLNVTSFLLYVAAGGFAVAFANEGPHWTIVGLWVAAFAGAIAQSVTNQKAPATSLSVTNVGDSIPVVNGANVPVAKVATLPPGAADHIAQVNEQANGGTIKTS